jgi:hypothetical protein
MDVFAMVCGAPHRPLGRNAQATVRSLYVAALRDLYGLTRAETARRVGLAERKVQDYHHRGAEIWAQYGGAPWALGSDGTRRYTGHVLGVR